MACACAGTEAGAPCGCGWRVAGRLVVDPVVGGGHGAYGRGDGPPAGAGQRQVAAQAPAAPAAETPSDAQIRKWVDEHPDLIIQALNRFVGEQKRKEQAEGDKNTLTYSGELLDATNAPFIGKANARVTVAYVLDAECGYCKTMTGILDEFVAKNPDVRIVGLLAPLAHSPLAAPIAPTPPDRIATAPSLSMKPPMPFEIR